MPSRPADHADRADEGGLLAEDLVTRQRQPVTAGRGHVLGEGDDGDALLFGELPDATVKQCRLNRRAARRIDDHGHGNEA